VSAQTVDPRLGTEIAGYRIEALAGRGGMSVVYRAEHLRLGRKVALKLLAPELAMNEAFRDRFIRESRLAASIDHPNIIPIYDADEVDGLLYIAMRYVEGTDLKGLVRREGPLETTRAVNVVSQAARALDAAQVRGLIHRDVKPGNILIVPAEDEDSSDHVYLSDFGLVKQAASESRLTGTGQFVGTVEYVAPEQIEGKPVDGRVDVYSLGCVLYECLTGRAPFERDSEVAVMWAHVKEEAPKATLHRSDLPPAVDDVVAKAMAKAPNDRYPTCGNLAADLRRELGVSSGSRPQPAGPPGIPAWAPSQPPGVPTRRWPGRLRTSKLQLGLGAAAVIAAGVAIFLLRPPQDPVDLGALRNAVGVIDPSGNEIVAGVSVGETPSAVAVGEGQVWVASFGDQTVSSLNPATNEVRSTLGISGTPSDAAIGEGVLWIANPFEGQIDKIDLQTGDKLPSVDVGSGVRSLAVGAGAVWGPNHIDGTLLRVGLGEEDAETIELGGTPEDVAVGEGAVWVTEPRGGKVYRVDPESNEVVERIAVRDDPFSIAVGEGRVWTANRDADSVSIIDPDTNSQVGSIPVGDSPVGIAVGEGAVWVASSLDGTVSRIDPATQEVVATIRLESNPEGIAAGEGFIWVTVHPL
jgi:YVTN family beta-propeller protein